MKHSTFCYCAPPVCGYLAVNRYSQEWGSLKEENPKVNTQSPLLLCNSAFLTGAQHDTVSSVVKFMAFCLPTSHKRGSLSHSRSQLAPFHKPAPFPPLHRTFLLSLQFRTQKVASLARFCLERSHGLHTEPDDKVLGCKPQLVIWLRWCLVWPVRFWKAFFAACGEYMTDLWMTPLVHLG